MNVLVLLPVDDAQRSRLEAAAPGARFSYATTANAPASAIEDADVIVGNLPPERLGESWRGTAGAGAYAFTAKATPRAPGPQCEVMTSPVSYHSTSANPSSQA